MTEKETAGFFDRIKNELDRWGIALEAVSCDDLTADCLKVVCMEERLDFAERALARQETLQAFHREPDSASRGRVCTVPTDGG